MREGGDMVREGGGVSEGGRVHVNEGGSGM